MCLFIHHHPPHYFFFSSGSPSVCLSVCVFYFEFFSIILNTVSLQSLSCLSAVSLQSLSCLSAVSQLSLSCLSAVSQLSLSCLSAVSQLFLSCLSAVSQLACSQLPRLVLFSENTSSNQRSTKYFVLFKGESWRIFRGTRRGRELWLESGNYTHK